MKNLIKSKIFWFFVVVTAAIGTYFGFKNNWWMEIPVEEPTVEVVEKTPKCEDFDNCEGCPNALEEMVYDETTIDSLNVKVTNVTE